MVNEGKDMFTIFVSTITCGVPLYMFIFAVDSALARFLAHEKNKSKLAAGLIHLTTERDIYIYITYFFGVL